MSDNVNEQGIICQHSRWIAVDNADSNNITATCSGITWYRYSIAPR